MRPQPNFCDRLIPEETKAFLPSKVKDNSASIQINAVLKASAHFQVFMDTRLQVDGETRRRLAVFSTEELINIYCRLLAYIVPWLNCDEVPPFGDPERRTFNLQMLETGWAALFIIYPSLPKAQDFQLAGDAAADAFDEPLYQWQNGGGFLPGYGYRMYQGEDASGYRKEGQPAVTLLHAIRI